MSRNIRLSFLIASVLFFSAPSNANLYVLKDAQNFAAMFTQSSDLSATTIQSAYLDVGTPGIEIFTPMRIQDAQNMATQVAKNPQDYKKAIEVCLPAAEGLQTEATDMLTKVKSLLGQEQAAPVYVLFGGNNSGGTASEQGLSLGLEVLCRFADTEEQFKDVLLAFIAHEIVHVYQSQARLYSNHSNDWQPTLLEAALIEGTADFIAEMMLNKVPTPEKERHEYGIQHEAEVWKDFKTSTDSTTLKGWFYTKGLKNRPNDMGYWVGKRIAQSYYQHSSDKKNALMTLIALQSPSQILKDSLYDPK